MTQRTRASILPLRLHLGRPAPDHIEMFDWLSKKFKQDNDVHPLSSDRGIDDFIEQLPTGKATLAIEAIGECFDQAEQLPLDAAQRRRLLRVLDKHAQGLVAELWHVLFEATQGETISEASWQGLYRYYGRVSAGFWLCLEQMPLRGKWTDEDSAFATVIACRGMAALMRRNLLMRIRYRASPDEFWQEVNQLYQRAEATGVLRAVVEAYADSGDQSSVLREYLSGLLLEVSPHGGLFPLQLVCLDLMLRHFSNLLPMREEPDENSSFFADPSRNRPPERWLPGLPRRERCRYFGIGAAQRYFETMLVHANEAKPMPDWVVGCGIDPRRYHELLERTLPQWSSTPPQRGSRRDALESDLLVVHGFSQVRRMLSSSEFARSGKQIPDLGYSKSKAFDEFSRLRFDTVQMHASQLAAMSTEPEKEKTLSPLEVLAKLELAGDKEMMGHWKQIDSSSGGFGAVVPKMLAWVRVGMLIAYRHADDIEWRPAMIRRRGRDAAGNQTCGAQSLGWPAASVRVRPLEVHEREGWDRLPGGGEGFVEAIFIEADPMLLVLPPGFFAPGREILLKARSDFRPFRLVAPIENGVDYDIVSCTQQTQASSAGV